MKKLCLLLCFSGFCLSLCGQEIYMFKGKNGKYGFERIINSIESEIIVEPKYDSCNNFFSSPITEVKLNDKWGFMDINGKEITSIKYDFCRSFCHNYDNATVKLDGKWGFVDTNGNEIILSKDYDDIGYPCRFLFDFEVWIYGNSEFELSQLFYGSIAAVVKNGKWGFINKKGEEIVPLKYDSASALEYDKILSLVKIGEKWGLMDTNGKEVVPVKYDEFDEYGWYDPNYIAARIDEKWGILDKTGKEFISIEYDDPPYMRKEYVFVQKNGKRSVLDTAGKEVIPIKYDNISGGVNNTFVVTLNGKCGLIDKADKEITPFIYTNMRYFVDTSRSFFNVECILRVELDEKWGIIDVNGKEILPIKYDKIDYAWVGDLGFISVQMNEKWGLINGKTGQETVPIKYDEKIIFDYKKYYAEVELDGKYGMVDTSGREIIPVIYDRCIAVGKDLTKLSLENEEFLIKNNTWKLVLPIKCKKVYCDDRYDEYNIIGILCDNKLFLVDKTSEEIIDSLICNDYRILSNDYIAIKRESGWGAISSATRKEVLLCEYEHLWEVIDKLKEMLFKNEIQNRR